MTTTDLHLPPLANPAIDEGGAITFIGTATLLVRLGTLTFLTDPNFLHAGDHAHLGYGLRSKRLTNPALELSELPPIDFVLLSHHHGDHFDQIVERQLDRNIPIITEPGSAKRLSNLGFQSIWSLSTWESTTVRRGLEWLTVTAMPARHAPRPIARLLPSVMGSMLQFGHGDGDPAFHMYVTGDTLLVGELAEIGRRHPEIDLCMLHLGGTRIAGILLTMDGKQGVQLLELLRPKTAIPIHFDDYTVFRSPLEDFLELAAHAQLSSRIVPLDRGSTHRFEIPNAENAVMDPFVNMFNSFIERDGRGWAVCAVIDGRRRVISRHPSAERAQHAERELSESANRTVDTSD